MKDLGVITNLQQALQSSQFDAVLLFGADHVRYASEAPLPFIPALPLETLGIFISPDEAVVLSPAWLKDTLRNEGNISKVLTYGPNDAWSKMEDLVCAAVKNTLQGGAVIGVPTRRISSRMMEQLQIRLDTISMISCDAWIRTLRMVKTEKELALLEDAAMRTDHALAAAAHHVMVYAARPEKGLSEIIRVHCLEREMDMSGYESLAVGASGEHTADPWPEAPYYGVGLGKQLQQGEWVRMEIRNSLHGYWSTAARMLTMGPPSDEQHMTYQMIVRLRKETLRILKAGARCCDVFDRVCSFAEEHEIPLVKELGLGHGAGVSPVEPPYLDPSDSTCLAPSMVLVLTPTVRGSGGELVRSFDTVLIEEDHSRILGWYRNWETPYLAVSSWQHGGG